MKRIISFLAAILVPLLIAAVQAHVTGKFYVYCITAVVVAAVIFGSLCFLGIIGRRYRHIDPLYGLGKASLFNGSVMLVYTLLLTVKDGTDGGPCLQDIPLLLSIIYLCIQILVSCMLSCFENGRVYKYEVLLTVSAVVMCLSVAVFCAEVICMSAGLACQPSVIKVCGLLVAAGAAGTAISGIIYFIPFLVLHKI